ncbi:hypothetical protein F901_02572 [Acinetobacter dispersus]|nr:hypothetical protein F901_02572 [Acinetobacter dispersus]
MCSLFWLGSVLAFHFLNSLSLDKVFSSYYLLNALLAHLDKKYKIFKHLSNISHYKKENISFS